MATEDDDRSPFKHTDQTLVDSAALEAAINRSARPSGTGKWDFLQSEPVLGSFCQDQILRLIGKLALAGAETHIVRDVCNDVKLLIDVTGNALREAYRALLKDLVSDPDDPVSESDESDENTDEEASDD